MHLGRLLSFEDVVALIEHTYTLYSSLLPFAIHRHRTLADAVNIRR